jgi:hypothetical protein
MKKHFISVVLGLMVLVFLSSCFHNHDISISVSDDEDEYEMEASYQKNKTHAVQVYLDDHLLNNRASSKRRWRNEEITLDDNTKIYLRSYPGELSIKIDKTENSEESYDKVRQACEELKEILADN